MPSIFVYHSGFRRWAIGQRLDAVPQLLHQRVELGDAPAGLCTVRTVAVSCVVGFVEIDHDELWAFRFRHLQHLQRVCHPLGIAQAGSFGVYLIIGGMLPLDGDVRADPVDVAGLYALALRRNPDRFAAVEGRVVARVAVAHGIHLSLVFRPERVGHNAVMVGIQSGGEGVVVGECLRGERGKHDGLYAFAGHLIEERGGIHLGIVPAESVERYDYRIVLVSGCGGQQ